MLLDARTAWVTGLMVSTLARCDKDAKFSCSRMGRPTVDCPSYNWASTPAAKFFKFAAELEGISKSPGI